MLILITIRYVLVNAHKTIANKKETLRSVIIHRIMSIAYRKYRAPVLPTIPGSWPLCLQDRQSERLVLFCCAWTSRLLLLSSLEDVG